MTTRGFTDELHYNDVAAFFKSNPPSGGEHTVQLALDGIEANVQWLERNEEQTCDWLRANYDVEE